MNNTKYYNKMIRLNIDHYSSETDYYVNAEIREMEKSILDLITPNSYVLDACCGSGRFSLKAAERSIKIMGIDITPAAIDTALSAAKERNLLNCRFEVADVTNLEFSNETFDFVICT